jgi:hypothetical protein
MVDREARKMSGYEPELGQACFSNTLWERYEMQDEVEAAISFIADYASKGRTEDDPTSNNGAEFSNDTFSMRAYCWCDGEEHGDGCPPNFEYKKFKASWYKYLGRGGSQSHLLSREKIWEMTKDCIESLTEA